MTTEKEIQNDGATKKTNHMLEKTIQVLIGYITT